MAHVPGNFWEVVLLHIGSPQRQNHPVREVLYPLPSQKGAQFLRIAGTQSSSSWNIQSTQLGCGIHFVWGYFAISSVLIPKAPDHICICVSVVETPSHQLTPSQSAVSPFTMLASYVWWVIIHTYDQATKYF